MRYAYYECKNHGRLSDEGYTISRVNADKTVSCNDCGNLAEQKFIIVCKHHGELSPEQIKPAKRSHGTCRICHRKSAGSARNNDRETYNKKMAVDREKNPEKWKKIYKKAYQNKREQHGDILSLIKVCARMGITKEEYYNLIIKQNNKCAICLKEETCIDGRSKEKKPRRLSIDHCHKTGVVRGLLCNACNIALGRFNDDVDLLKKAINYIKKNQ